MRYFRGKTRSTGRFPMVFAYSGRHVGGHWWACAIAPGCVKLVPGRAPRVEELSWDPFKGLHGQASNG